MYEYMTAYYSEEPYYRPDGYRGVLHILLIPDEEVLTAYKELAAEYEEQAEALEGETDPQAESAGTEPAEPAEEEPKVTWEQVEAAKQAVIASVQPKIDEIKAALDAETPFLDLVDQYGEDPGMQDAQTRENGYQVHPDSVMYDPAFVQGAFSVEHVGDVSEPVVGSYGVHLIYYLKDIAGGAVELTDAIRATLRDSLEGEMKDARYEEVRSQWMAEADIVWTEAGEEWRPALTEEDDE